MVIKMINNDDNKVGGEGQGDCDNKEKKRQTWEHQGLSLPSSIRYEHCSLAHNSQ